ncbi:unnamed protein product [Brassica napus]|nr:unnamed protein product [Brassica napus]
MMDLLVCDSELFSPDLPASASATGSSSDVHGGSEFLSPSDPPDPPDPPDLDFDSNSITAVCSLIYWSSSAPSKAIRLYFGPSSFSPQVSQICGSLVAGFVIRSDILLGWYYEALVTAIDLFYVLVNVQSFFHLSCCLRSSQSFRIFTALFLCGLGSFVTTLKVSNGNSLALEQPLTVVYSFSLVCAVTVDALLLFSPHSWQLGKKCDNSCFLTLNRSSLGCDSLVFSVMEPTYLQNLSLGLGDSFAGSIVSSMEVFRFISSCTNLYSDTQDSPVLQGFTSRMYDLSAFVAVCLTLLVALVVIISMGISKLVYKVDCQELTNLLSESWSFDVHRILLVIRSLIFSFVALYAHFSCCCAYVMVNSLARDAFLCCNTSSVDGVLNV